MYRIPDFALDHLLFLLSVGLRTAGLVVALALIGFLVQREGNQRTGLLTLIAASSLAYLAGPLLFKLGVSKTFLVGVVIAACASGYLLLGFSLSVLRHDFRWKTWHTVLCLCLSALGAVTYFLPQPRPEVARLITLATAAAAVWSLRKPANGLSALRLSVRRRFVEFAAVANATVVLGETLGQGGYVPEAIHGLVLIPVIVALGYAFVAVVSDPETLLAPVPDPAPKFCADFIADFNRGVSSDWMSEPDLTLDRFAERLGYPVYLVRRYLTAGLGHDGFPAFLNERRIERARELLSREPSQSLTQLAFDLGFGSVGTFNRAFKRIVGTSPSGYRDTLTA